MPRLRIYPHALRDSNAYYSPKKKALLFGYFPASTSDPGHNLPGGTVFTCLSHDVVAHETTHALLDGLHRRFIEPTNPDTLALHEGFADIVALFQHFSFAPALRDQIRRTRGDLASQNLLGQLAQQFGQAIGNRGALRDALGAGGPGDRRVGAQEPDPADLQTAREPHARGAILVAAVFDAFLAIYKSRIADLLRIATAGTGVLPQGDLHPDLVERLAGEASLSASHVLNMCIRALDHCPPVDVNFGDYLRALVTADRDLVPDDDRGYRVAVIEAFRRRGIYPQGVRSLSAESLCWAAPVGEVAAALHHLLPGVKRLRRVRPDWSLTTSRRKLWKEMQESCPEIHGWLLSRGRAPVAANFGLALGADAPRSIERNKDGLPLFEVHSVRPARRLGPDGQTLTDLVIEITQKRHGYLNPLAGPGRRAGTIAPPPHDFWLRGGCTVLVDLDRGAVRYCIGKGIANEARLAAQRAFVTGRAARSRRPTSAIPGGGSAEPFAMLHHPPAIEEETFFRRSHARRPRDDRPRLRRQGPHVPPGSRRLLPARLRHRRRAPLLHADRLRRAAGHRGRRGAHAAGRREPPRRDRRPDRRPGRHPPALGPPVGVRPGARGLRPDRLRRGLGGLDGGPRRRPRQPPAGAAQDPSAGARRARRRTCGRPARADGRHSRGRPRLLRRAGGGRPPVAASRRRSTTCSAAASRRATAPRRDGSACPAPGGRVHVLGPPQDEALLLRSTPSQRASEVYEKRLALTEETAFFAAASPPWPGPAPEPPRRRSCATSASRSTRVYRVDPERAKRTSSSKSTTTARRRPAGGSGSACGNGGEPGPPRGTRPRRTCPGGGSRRTGSPPPTTSRSSSTATPTTPAWPWRSSCRPAARCCSSPATPRWATGSRGTTAQLAAGRLSDAADLLRRTALYKVGHHASHNATLREKGLELMERPDLVAMIPVDEQMAHRPKGGNPDGWDMPFAPLLDRLKAKTRGRVLRADTGAPPPEDLAGCRTPTARRSRRRRETALYLEITILP